MRLFEIDRVLTVAARAAGALEDLADDLPYVSPDDREALRAGIEFERALLETCRYALPVARTGPNGPV